MAEHWARIPKVVGIFFKLARCRYTLGVTSKASYSPEYITPTQKKLMFYISRHVIGLDKNHQMYCVRKMTTIAIRLPITYSAAEIRNGKIWWI